MRALYKNAANANSTNHGKCGIMRFAAMYLYLGLRNILLNFILLVDVSKKFAMVQSAVALVILVLG